MKLLSSKFNKDLLGLARLKYYFSAFFLIVLLASCEKDEPSCANCPANQGDSIDSTAIDPRQKYVGRFKVKFIYYSRYYSMSSGSYNYGHDTSTFNVAVTYLPVDSALMNMNNYPNQTTTYVKQPALTFTIQGQNPAIFPYSEFPLVKTALYTGGVLAADPSPFNKGGFVNPDSINFTWSNDLGVRDAVTKKVYGHKIP